MSILQLQSFGIPSPDDLMETDAGRHTGQVEDIDIDLDLSEEQQQDLEDEYMSEDVGTFNHQRTDVIESDEAYNDDEMVDDGNTEQNVIYEPSIQDEDLRDAEEINTVQPDEDDEIVDIADDEPFATPQIQDVSPYGEPSRNETPTVQSQQVSVSTSGWSRYEDRTPSPQHINREEDTIQSQENQESSREQEAAYPIAQSPARDLEDRKTQDVAYEPSLSVHTDGQQQCHTVGPPASVTAVEALSQNVGYTPIGSNERVDHHVEDVGNTTHNRQVQTYNDTFDGTKEPIPESLTTPTEDPVGHHADPPLAASYIHPVIVDYEGAQISLFRPAEGERDFILEDESLASESFAELFAACRPVLGEDVSQQELVFRVDDLDLQICESANDTSTTTISQLIDIYLQLHHHDGIEHPPELRLTLSTQPSLSHRLETLRNALGEGKGLSQVRLTEYDQEVKQHTSTDHFGKYEDVNAHDGASESTDVVPQEQKAENNRFTVSESKSGSVPVVSAVQVSPVSQCETLKAKIPTSSEQASNATIGEQNTEETFLSTTDDRHDKHSPPQHTTLPIVEDPAKNETQVQRGQEPAFSDDQENIIDHEDEPIKPKPSSGSSDLYGDVEKADQSAPLSAAPDADTEVVSPDTQTSSRTLEESIDDVASRQLNANEEADDPYNVEDGNDEAKNALEGEENENLESSIGDSKAPGENYEERSVDELDNLARVDDSSGGNHQHRNDHADEGDHNGVLKTHEDGSVEYHSENFLHDEVDAVGGKDYIKDTADHGRNGANDQSGIQLLVDVTEGPETTAVDEHQVYGKEASDDAGLQGQVHAVVTSEDNDEITYDDGGEDEDEGGDSEALNIEREQLPGLASLKRSRDHPDVDGFEVEGLKDAKRTRSNAH